jgi:allantoinase
VSDSQHKILSSVLICAGDNSLQPADIHFTDTIWKIAPRSDTKIQWKEIADPEDWKRLRQSISPIPYPSGAHVYSGGWNLLMPGAIDSHVHFNTPGFEDREDFEHGSLAAASGGVTTVIDMPCTSIPPVTNARNLYSKLKSLTGRSWVDFAFWGGVSGTDFEDPESLYQSIIGLVDAGVVGFKVYLTSGMESFTDLTITQLLQVSKHVGFMGLPLAVHAEHKNLVVERQATFQKSNRNDYKAYCQTRDSLAEAVAISALREIVKETEQPIHIVHLSSARGVELLRETRWENLPFTAETCPHYLHFTNEDFADPHKRNYLKTAPPVKTEVDRAALWEALSDGTLSFVTTDHAGCDPDKEKSSSNFWEVYGGIPGVEHRVPYLFSEGFKKGKLTLAQTIDLLSTAPATFFKLAHCKGGLDIGKDADFALINLWTKETVSASKMHSKGKYTPFEGMVFEAVVEETYLRGCLVVDRNEETEVAPGYGQWLRRK